VLRDLAPQERGEVGVAAISLRNTDKPATPRPAPAGRGRRRPTGPVKAGEGRCHSHKHRRVSTQHHVVYSEGIRGHTYKLIIMQKATTDANPPTIIENTASVLPAYFPPDA
jgi:hypothetical protein